MNESIFFQNVNIFDIPGSLGTARIFLWAVIFWLMPILVRLYTNEFRREVRINLNGLDYCIISLIVLSIVGLMTVATRYPSLEKVLVEFLTLVSLFAGYFIIKDWSSRYDSTTIKEFLFVLVVINSIASVLYILHQGLGLEIYQYEESSADFVQGEEITRTFWFMPQFLFLAVAYLLVFKKEKPLLSIILLIINILAIFITYTRSALINAILIFLLYSVFVGIKKKRVGIVIRDAILYMVGGLVGLVILSQVMPANSEYLMGRFRELGESSSSPLQMNTLEYRFMMTGMVFDNIDTENLFYGMGPVTEDQESLVPTMKHVTSDMVWAGVTYRWGFIGFLVFIILYGLAVSKAYIIFIRYDNTVTANLGLLLLLYVISQIIESFVSWTFMSGHGYVTGLWYFALISSITSKSTKNLKPIFKGVRND